MNKYTYKDGKFYKNDIEFTMKQVCKQLNNLEEIRIRRNKEIIKLHEVEELQRDVIEGVKAYIRLKEVWY